MRAGVTALFLFLFLAPISYSQFDILNKVKEKVEEELSNPKEEEKQNTENGNDEVSDNENTESGKVKETKQTGLKAYSKYDFVPGQDIIFYDDFSQEAIGDFPQKWNTNGSGEVVTLNNYDGKWFKMINAVSYIPYLELDTFGDNFTVEFDLLINPENSNNGGLYFDFYSDKEVDKVPSASSGPNAPGLNFEFHPKNGSTSTFVATGMFDNGGHIERSDQNRTESKGFVEGEVNRLSLSFNKTRFRAYLNDKKVIDLPRILKANTNINKIAIRTWYWNDEDEQPILFKNVRVAQGQPDTRNDLITKGKLVTRGINFDSGSDKIKPESYGTLKDISTVLQENQDIKVKIIGHTDADGDESQNAELSQKRATAVKIALSNEFGIDASRLDIEGKGESDPVSANDSPEGKANNRRVEFVKL